MKTLVNYGLMVLILVGGLFLPLVWEDAAFEQPASGRSSLAEPVYEIQVDENSNVVYVRTRHQTILRDLHTGEFLPNRTVCPAKITTMNHVPGSDRLVAGCVDGRVLMLEGPQAPVKFFSGQSHELNVVSSAISHSRRIAATGSMDALCLWDLERRQLLARLPINGATPNDLHFSPDDDRLAAGFGNGCVRIYQTKDLRLLHEFQPSTDSIVAAKFIEEGRKILTVQLHGVIDVLEIATGAIHSIPSSCRVNFLAVAVSSEHGLFALADWSNSIRIHSLETGKKITSLIGHAGAVSSLRFSASEPWLYSGSHDGTLRIWSLENFTEISSCPGSLPFDEALSALNQGTETGSLSRRRTVNSLKVSF